MRLLISYLKKYKAMVIVALLLATINQVFSLMDPLIFKRIVDEYAAQTHRFTKAYYIKGVGGLILLSMGAAMVSRIAKNFQDYFVNVITQKLGAQIYSDGLKHSLQLPYQVFEDQRSGETLGKLQKVRTDVEKLINSFIGILFTSLVGIVFVMIYAIKIHWLIAPVYFTAVPLLGFISSFLSKKIKTIQKRIVNETTALAGSTTESLRNIELVKSLGLADQEINRLNATTVRILGLELKKVRYVRSISFVQGTFVNLLRSSILFLLLYLIFADTLTIGELFSLQIYSFFIFGPLQELGNIINVYREAEVSLDNFKEILEMPIAVKPTHPISLQGIQKLAFNQVSFQHQSARTKALDGISFEVGQGETIAFVGPSGAGKTSLVKLLVGLYQPLSGSILYNDINAEDVDLDQLRSQIGFVTQDTQLFSGTIKENLLFVAPNATDQECLSALEKAACQSLLSRAEFGLETVIGEGGVKVSGGEKQRLSIARALLRNPSLMVFDEATSALDSLTEEEISTTIKNLASDKGKMTILIAHRLSTIMHADRIIVLEKGKITESGGHDELLELKGLYYAMWRQQIGER
jgi:ATP-binding cassette subfamily B protein